VVSISDKAITLFQVVTTNGSAATALINEADHEIAVSLPFGSDPTSLVPIVTHTGASLHPEDHMSYDFTEPMVFTVMAPDGSTQDYTVHVSVAPAPIPQFPPEPHAITSFDFPTADDTIVTIDQTTHAIHLVVPVETTLTNLAPTITITGAVVSPASGIPRDFSHPVTYTVTGLDGLTQDYTVTVSVSPLSGSKNISSFIFTNASHAVYIIDGTDVLVGISHGSVVTGLIPSITHTGVNISPEPGEAMDFTHPVSFTVTAQDGTTKTYTVTVDVN
jgi:hypothetical protein